MTKIVLVLLWVLTFLPGAPVFSAEPVPHLLFPEAAIEMPPFTLTTCFSSTCGNQRLSREGTC
jgi:hypothetical protein